VIGVVNGGHNDALIGLALLGGVLLAADRRPAAAGLALAAAALVKIILVLPLAFALLWLWRNQGMRAALVASYVSVGVVLGGYALAGGISVLEPLQESRLGVSRSSIWSGARRSVTIDLVESGWRGRDADPVARQRVVRWANVCVAGMTLLIVVPGLRSRTPALLVGGAALAYLLVGAYAVAWYSAWALIVLALMPRSWVTCVALAQSALLAVAYIPDPIGPVDRSLPVTPWQSLRIDIYAMWVPLAEACLIALTIALSLRSLWRMNFFRRGYVAMSAMTPKWSLAKVPVSERSQTTRADSTLPAPPSRRQPTKM
jgi:hypothetical protein